jgi:predicted ATPase
LKQDLVVHHLCEEIALERLDEPDIAEYLARQFETRSLPTGLADLIYRHSGGNALFMTALVSEMVKNGLIRHQPQGCELTKPLAEIDLGVPETLQRMIEVHLEQLTAAEQRALKCASVVGDRFSVWAITVMLDLDQTDVEDICEGLAERQQFILPADIQDQPDGSGSAHYHFTHALYREALYRQLSPARPIRLHRIIGERLEDTGRNQLSQIASELAIHFQECRDFARAIRYWRLVAQRCAERHALQGAIDALTAARDLTRNLPESDRSSAELELAEQLGLAYRLMGDLDTSAKEFERMFERARGADNIEGQIRAQLSLAGVASFMNRTRCLPSRRNRRFALQRPRG